MDSSLKQQFQQDGYVIVRGAIDKELAEEARKHVEWLREKNPSLKPEDLHHGLVKDDPFWHYLISQPRLIDIAQEFLEIEGPVQGVGLFASHYIAKGPKKGLPTLWHQDGSYWPLDPMKVVTLWLCVTPSTKENGCMKAIPGTHTTQLHEMLPNTKDDNLFQSGIDESLVDESKTVYFEMQPGDVSIHHPNLIHGSDMNLSDTWRIGLTIRYIPTSTLITVPEAGSPYLLRGEKVTNNNYMNIPKFDASKHFPFSASKLYE